ncbi:hypothetical protein [Ancylobacter mangrovi]|uniref:hypothetical protein n=1 Tax=Ancylobacter mangrovi TaxID=2972472 RepID=UPI002163B31E|nr:hypothetical protein [Ancylobacter mangrovi]
MTATTEREATATSTVMMVPMRPRGIGLKRLLIEYPSTLPLASLVNKSLRQGT